MCRLRLKSSAGAHDGYGGLCTNPKYKVLGDVITGGTVWQQSLIEKVATKLQFVRVFVGITHDWFSVMVVDLARLPGGVNPPAGWVQDDSPH